VVDVEVQFHIIEIHDRQAIILEPREYAEWLNGSERPPLHLLRILPDEDLVIDAVGPLPLEKPEPQRGLFE
jgi:putative SOS response-associated peptidase YedK